MSAPRASWVRLYVADSEGRRRRANRGRDAAHQLRAIRGDDAGDAGGDGSLCARGNAAARELGCARARPARFLVLRQRLERPLPRRDRRPRAEGALPGLRLSQREVRVLRQPALRERPRGRPGRGQVRRAAQLRVVRHLHRARKGRARLRGGHRLDGRRRRRALGPAIRALHGGGARRAGLHGRAHARPAVVVAAPQHRPSPGHAGHERLDGAGLRDRRGTRGDEGLGALLGANA